MPTVDPVQAWSEHTVALINADSELRTLMGRTTQLVVPWEAFVVDGPVPMIAYAEVAFTGGSSRAERLTAQFAVFGPVKSTCNTICARLKTLLRFPAYAARGADIAQDPATLPDRRWPPAAARQDDAAVYRADIDLTFLLTG